MFQIFDFGIIEIVIPKPEIITITALVLLAAGIIPNLIPSILMCLIMLCKRRLDGLNEFSTQKPLSIVVLRKELICAITEHGTYRFPVVQQNISTYFQLRAVWDIYFAAIKVIQEIMGHADIETTMNIYAEATKEKKKESFSNLEGKIKIS